MQPALLDIKLIAFCRISDGIAKGLAQSPVSVHVECKGKQFKNQCCNTFFTLGFIHNGNVEP
jgi:hypothetical protein